MSFACACHCRGPVFPTATRGRSRRARASCCSTPACTARTRSRTSSARSRCVDLRLRGHEARRLHARPLRPLRPGRDDRRAGRVRAVDAPQPRADEPDGRGSPRRCSRGAWRSRARAACRRSRCAATRRRPPAARTRASRARSCPIATSSTASASQTDLGEWVAYETPGHSPSHVCLFQPERRLLISGDHLLGRISLYFEYGYSPDPVGEFLTSLDVVERLARTPVPGGARAHVHRRAGAHPRQPRADRRTPRGCARRARRESSSRPSSCCRTCTTICSRRRTRQRLLYETLGILTHLRRDRQDPAHRRRARALDCII